MQMIQDLVYAPTDGNILYMCTDTSQVWKSIDGGKTWTPKNNGISSVGVVAITVSPYDADIVLVCGFMNNQGTNEERGVFKTTDGGDTWALVLAKTLITNSQRGSNPIAFASATTVYAGDGTGKLWKSTDTGSTWAQIATIGTSIWDIKVNPADSTILFVCSNAGYRKVVDSGSVTVTSLGSLPANPTKTVISPTTSSTMYVCIPSYGIYKSTNTGSSFSTVNTGFHSGLTGGPKYLSISPVAGGSDLLYCSFGTPAGGSYLGKMYYSNNSGGNWVTPTAMDTQNADGWVCGSLRDNNAAVSASSGSPIATHPTTKNSAFAVVGYHLMVKTTDGGDDWSNTTDGGNTGYTGALSGQTPFNGRGDATSITFDPNNSNRYIFSNADYGNYLTTDGGSTFSKLTAVGFCRGTVIDPVADSDILLSITSPSGYFSNYIKRSTNGGTSWTQVGGDGKALSFIMFDAADANKVYTNLFKSTDRGITWSAFVGTDTTKKTASVYRQGTHIYSTTLSGSTLTLWRSSDGGVTWTRNTVGNPAVQYPQVTAVSTDYYGQITVAPDDPDKIYIAQSSLGLWIINGVSGTLTTFPLGNYPYREAVVGSGYNRMDVSMVAVDPNDSDVVYVGKYSPFGYTAESLFRSEDGGVTFTDISGNLKYTFATSLTVNPHDSYVYVGGHHGTWKLPPPGVAGTGTVGAAPTVVTGAATVVTSITATLNAEVNPNGSSTTARWQYNTSSQSWGTATVTGSQTVGAGTSSVGIQQAITGLSGSTTYYVRCQANSINGSTNGSEITFTTSGILSYEATQTGTNTVTVDGVLTEYGTWSTLSKVIMGTPTATGSFSVLYVPGTSGGLYVGVSISGATVTVNTATTTPWQDSSVELYIDRDYNRNTSYDAYDRQFVRVPNNSYIYSQGTTTGVVASGTNTAETYSIEFFVPASNFIGGSAFSAGNVIGFDVFFNEDTNGGNREGQKGWNGDSNNYLSTVNFGQLTCIATSTVSEGSAGTSTFNIAKDSTVNESSGSTNYGMNIALWARNGTAGFRRQGFIEVDIGNPGSVTAAALYVYGSMDTGSAYDFGLFGVNAGSWTESDVTWNNKPGTTTPSIGSFTVPGTTPQWCVGTITNYVQTLVGTTNVSLCISGISPTVSALCTLNSSEHHNSATTSPYLLVSYTIADAAAPVGTVTVNSNGTYTTAIEVTLNLSATDDVGVTGYYLSGSTTTPTAGQAGWVSVGTDTTYSDNIPYTLSEEDGTKTVNIWYKDGVSNVSAMASDTIILDLAFPSISITSLSSNYTLSDGTNAFGTTSSTIALSGSSTDTNGIETVTVSNSATTTTRTATGTSSWSSTERILPFMDDGLVFYAKLDDGTGSTQIKDSSRFLSHGTNTGSVPGITSVFGLARYFDGIDDYVSFGDPADGHLDFGTGSFSISFWMVRIWVSGAIWQYPLSKYGDGTGNSYNFQYISSLSTQMNFILKSGTQTIYAASTQEIGTNAVVHVVGVCDRETAYSKLFINGVQTGTQSFAGLGSITNSYPLVIGALNTTNNSTKGYLDEVRIYNRALSSADVLQLYQLTTPDQVNIITVTAEDVPGNEASDIIAIGAFPSVQTDYATSVTYKSGQLNGNCNANNNTTTVWFDYGLESGYYTGSSSAQVITGAVDTAVNISLANLDNTNTYYYRLVAENAVGKTYGIEFNFDLLPTPDTVLPYFWRSDRLGARFPFMGGRRGH